jgi:glyoxylase-like metal-dependent hydrolase (beta-lactamase superfamily II)
LKADSFLFRIKEHVWKIRGGMVVFRNPKKSKFFLMLLIAVMLLPSTFYASTQNESKKVLKGDLMSKAEFIAKISTYFAWPHPSDYNDIWKTPLKQFNDVETTDQYGKEIEAAYEEGIISPDAEGNFNPDNEISRQDAAVILANVFKITESDNAAKFIDYESISQEARGSVNALVEWGFMSGRTPNLFKPNEPIKKSEVDKIFNNINSKMVTPVQALPKQNAVAPRRYVKLYTPTPGATIYYTTDGSEPTTSSKIYSVETTGHINEMLNNSQLPERTVVYKAIAVKDGMVTSPVQTFTWNLYRPVIDEFQHKLIKEKTSTSPAVYQLYNDSESVRPMAWYIEGQDKGILFDALQTRADAKNLKEYIDENIAKKPYSVVVGHSHGDHMAQAPNFADDHDIYVNERGWASIASVLNNPEDQAKVKNIEEGDIIDIGGSKLYVYALPGHDHSDVILQDKENGLIFASDIYGCTRAGSADNVAVMGVRTDLFLSLVQQTYSNFKKDGGKINQIFTGHDESSLEASHLGIYEAALQQVIDKGEAGTSPTLRGNNDAPNSRTTIIGDMWKDGTNWIAIKLPGIKGDNTEYLTSSPINYNGQDGFRKYSVLSNIEIEGGKLVGKTVQWAESRSFTWAGNIISVNNSLPNKFDPWSYDYTIEVPKSNDAITLIPTTMSTMVKSIRINGKKVDYRSRTTIPVSDGSVITIDIVAPDKVTTSTYTFTVDKK